MPMGSSSKGISFPHEKDWRIRLWIQNPLHVCANLSKINRRIKSCQGEFSQFGYVIPIGLHILNFLSMSSSQKFCGTYLATIYVFLSPLSL